MAFDELTRHRVIKAIAAFVKSHRPPPSIRKELDLSYRLTNQSVEIFEIRPRWQHPDETIECPVAKATFVKTQDVWKIYWMRQDLKWHSYPLLPEVNFIEEFLEEVALDPSACFWG
jgi:hypothetical protein